MLCLSREPILEFYRERIDLSFDQKTSPTYLRPLRKIGERSCEIYLVHMGGTVLFIASWLMIWRISAFAFPLSIGLMSLGAVMRLYAGLAAADGFFFLASLR